MARLFVFAIGGTGARVLKSLSMLLAAGVKTSYKSEFEIVPILIDPHSSNEDLKRTIKFLTTYQHITQKTKTKNGFFGTKVTTLDSLANNRITSNFSLNLNEVGNTRFRDYIEYNQLSPETRALADILFSGQSINKNQERIDLLDIEMDIGFVGNPNIGSVVLNRFKNSAEFREFANNFGQDDRIFIISSIFGGTGAAGFPAILKNIREAHNNSGINNKDLLRNAKIGAITVLPYFNIEKDENSPINKSDFIAKTKAALQYYKDNITGNNSINALYYIADDYIGKPYENDPGNGGQKNKAHFVEVAAALSILDFLKHDDEDLETIDGVASNPLYKEFCTRNDEATLSFPDLNDDTARDIELRLAQFFLFNQYLEKQLSNTISTSPWALDSPIIDGSFLSDSFYRIYLSDFKQAFFEWLDELSTNQRGFAPFRADSKLESFLVGRTPKKGTFSIFKSTFDFITIEEKLNKVSKTNKGSYPNEYEKLIKLFYDTTEEVLVEKFALSK